MCIIAGVFGGYFGFIIIIFSSICVLCLIEGGISNTLFLCKWSLLIKSCPFLCNIPIFWFCPNLLEIYGFGISTAPFFMRSWNILIKTGSVKFTFTRFLLCELVNNGCILFNSHILIIGCYWSIRQKSINAHYNKPSKTNETHNHPYPYKWICIISVKPCDNTIVDNVRIGNMYIPRSRTTNKKENTRQHTKRVIKWYMIFEKKYTQN